MKHSTYDSFTKTVFILLTILLPYFPCPSTSINKVARISSVLNTYLENFQNCLVSITQYNKVDLPNLKFPVILRFIDTYNHQYKKIKFIKYADTEFESFQIHVANETVIVDIYGNIYANLSSYYPQYIQQNESLFECKQSRYLHGGPDFMTNYKGKKIHFHHLCRKIKLLQFSFNTRPWRYEAYVDILLISSTVITNKKRPMPESYFGYWFYDNRLLYGDNMKSDNDKASMLSMTPLSSPRVHFLITPKYYDDPKQQGKVGSRWLYFKMDEKHWLFGNLDVLCYIVLSKTTNYFTFITLKPKQMLKKHKPMDGMLATFTNLSAKDLSILMTQNEIRLEESYINLIQSFSEVELQCRLSKISTSYDRIKYVLKFMPLETIFHFAQDEMWKDIIQNGTGKDPCEFSLEEFRALTIKISPYTFATSATNLPSHFYPNVFRFVSCGRAEKTGLPFEELFFSFEYTAWLWIFGFLLLGVSFVLSMLLWISGSLDLRKFDKLTLSVLVESLFSSYKLLVEQGNPFKDSVATNSRLKFLLSMIFLGAFVISNAYKRENMLRMIQPRGQVPYHFISQLTNHSFDIYTRARSIRFNGKYREKGVSQLSYFSDNDTTLVSPHVIVNPGGLRIEGEVLTMSDTTNDYHEYLSQATIHPETTKDPDFQNIGNFEGSKLRMKLLLQQQTNIVTKEVRKCTMKAAILPEYVALEMESELMKYNEKDKVYVGKEVLWEGGTFFVVKFEYHKEVWTFSKDIIGRMNGYKNSGIMFRWQRLSHWLAKIRKPWNKRLLVGANEGEENSEGAEAVEEKQDGHFEATTMKGNIVVIFVLLLGGLLFSVTIFVMERIAAINMRILYYNVKSKVHKILNYKCFKCQ